MKPGDLVVPVHRVGLALGSPILVVKENREVMGVPYLVLVNTLTGAQFFDAEEHYVPVTQGPSLPTMPGD